MTFSRREKLIVAASFVALLTLLLDIYILTPLLNERESHSAERERLLVEVDKARSIMRRGRRLEAQWRRAVVDGLKRDGSDAEGQFLRAIRGWFEEGGVAIASLRPEHSPEDSELPEILVHASGTGNMAGVAKLLWQIETARIPARIKMLQLGGRKEGLDDLSIHLKVSTIYSPDDVEPDSADTSSAQ
jgi:hypothetical protein